MRIPFIIRAPWLAGSIGRRSGALVEVVDLFRTLTDLAGIPVPTAESHAVAGESVVPAMTGGARISNFSFSQFAKSGPDGAPFGTCMGCLPTGHSAADLWGSAFVRQRGGTRNGTATTRSEAGPTGPRCLPPSSTTTAGAMSEPATEHRRMLPAVNLHLARPVNYVASPAFGAFGGMTQFPGNVKATTLMALRTSTSPTSPGSGR